MRPYIAIIVMSTVVLAIVFGYVLIRSNDSTQGDVVSPRTLSPASQEHTDITQSESHEEPPGINETQQAQAHSLELENKKEAILNALFDTVQTRPPMVRYQESIELARAGDANAQYEVSQALQKCSELPREAAMDRLRDRRDMDSEILGAIEIRHSECLELFSVVSHNDLEKGKIDYLERSATQGHPLALLRTNAVDGFDPDFDKRKLFIDAFKLKNPDIFELMTLYHGMNNETDYAELAAWNLFQCNENPVCSPTEVAENIVQGELAYRSTEIANRVTEIRSALEDEEWDSLVPNY